jgi:hypothetical protein
VDGGVGVQPARLGQIGAALARRGGDAASSSHAAVARVSSRGPLQQRPGVGRAALLDGPAGLGNETIVRDGD